MLYCSWDIARDGCKLYFSFWAIFCPFTSLVTQKIYILKKWIKKHIIAWCTAPDMWCTMDGQTDGKSDIERWVPHLKWHWFLWKNWLERHQIFCLVSVIDTMQVHFVLDFWVYLVNVVLYFCDNEYHP